MQILVDMMDNINDGADFPPDLSGIESPQLAAENVGANISYEPPEEENFVSSVLGSYFERFTAVVNSSHQSFLEHHQRLLQIKADVAILNSRIAENRRDMKKRMQNAVHVTESLSAKIRKIAARSVDDEEDEGQNTGDDMQDQEQRPADDESTVVL